MRLLGSLIAIAAVLTVQTYADQRTRYRIVDLGRFSDELSSWAQAVNNGGAVAGVGDFQRPDQVALLWSGGAITPLPPLPGNLSSMAYAINNRGEVAGATLTPDGRNLPTLWSRGQVIDLGLLPNAVSGNALGMNERGDIVGEVNLFDTSANGQHAFVWRHGEMAYLGPEFESVSLGFSAAWAINNRGQIVGQMGAGTAFLWDRGQTVTIGSLGGNGSQALAINDRGDVAGWGQTASGLAHAFLWSHGRALDLGALPHGCNSVAFGLNNRREVVGQSEVNCATGESHAFVWRDGLMLDLGTLSGSTFSRAQAINERGEIVGTSTGEMQFLEAVRWIPVAGRN